MIVMRPTKGHKAMEEGVNTVGCGRMMLFNTVIYAFPHYQERFIPLKNVHIYYKECHPSHSIAIVLLFKEI